MTWRNREFEVPFGPETESAYGPEAVVAATCTIQVTCVLVALILLTLNPGPFIVTVLTPVSPLPFIVRGTGAIDETADGFRELITGPGGYTVNGKVFEVTPAAVTDTV